MRPTDKAWRFHGVKRAAYPPRLCLKVPRVHEKKGGESDSPPPVFLIDVFLIDYSTLARARRDELISERWSGRAW